jgi:hypothetical protein
MTIPAASDSDSEDSRLALVLARVAEKRETRQGAFRAVLGAGVSGAKLAAEVARLLGKEVAAGSLDAISAAIELGSVALLHEAGSRVEQSGKRVDWMAGGIGLAEECARAGARASGAMREQWIRLLMACIDSERGASVRLSDVELLRTLNPPDALLLLVFGRYNEVILKEWMEGPVWAEASQNNNVRGRPGFIPVGLIVKWSETILGAPLIVSPDELDWAARERTIGAGESTPMPPPLFSELLIEDHWSKFIERGPEVVHQHPHARMLEKVFKIQLRNSARRLVNLLAPDGRSY